MAKTHAKVVTQIEKSAKEEVENNEQSEDTVKEVVCIVRKIICKLIGHKIVNKKGHWHSYCLRCGKDKVWGLD
ncbi:hypothetical protein [Paenibacillus sp. IHBB 3054]|uniref:hypothetical protein n=1 Tax=Paenibacillus sp. IHBB 3054 TaxID=3425689 RepID=UPI003F67FDF5